MNKQSIFLYGPSGAGKSSVGKLLAENLKLPFVDLDQEIEAHSGLSIPEIFSKEAELGFRQREQLVLRNAISSIDQVVALGGGTLTNHESRQLVESLGHVVLLNAPPGILLKRLKSDDNHRPLLAGDSEKKLAELLLKREEHYASFPLQVDTANKTPETIAREIQTHLGMFHLKSMATVQLPGYDVRVQARSLDHLGEMLVTRGLRGPVAVVTDENVGELYLARVKEILTNSGFETRGIIIPPGEEHKTLETVSNLWDAFLSTKVERGSTVVAMGGGVVGDLAGFAAGTFLRGVPWVAVPTTLLAIVDASLGGKTGADLPQGKNLIGAFYPPRLVVADPQVLATLPETEFISGLAEVVKHGVIADALLLNLEGLAPRKLGVLREELQGLEKIIRRAMAVKIRIIEEDPFEKGVRAALNFGHTVGHGVELVSGFKVRHGEAVAIGMVVEAQMAEEIGLASAGIVNVISAVLEKLKLPTEIPPHLNRNAIIDAMKRDKKKADGIVRFALPAKIGDVRVGIEVENWEEMISVNISI
ncbi:MAG: 3-dehydroquinate synthase [Anaerolineales bacterium]|nr:3-dehydroquinate synthase [Chloroflexota bacterium]MBL6980465.1 3-dehydroquinate synthase [Anaerolineales bacterium]